MMTAGLFACRELIHDLAEIGGDAHRAVVLHDHEGEAHRERDPCSAHEGQQGTRFAMPRLPLPLDFSAIPVKIGISDA